MTAAPASRPPPTPAFLTCTETSALARAISLRTSVERSWVADATSWPSVRSCRGSVLIGSLPLLRSVQPWRACSPYLRFVSRPCSTPCGSQDPRLWSACGPCGCAGDVPVDEGTAVTVASIDRERLLNAL